jgi:3-mercaptopyruvate sulfurtransferase SseA
MVARTLNFCGHHGVKYLKGGLSAWRSAGGSLVETTESGVERPLARFRESRIRSLVYALAGAFSPRVFGIALAGSAALIAGALFFMR